jgi:hypothetical protein
MGSQGETRPEGPCSRRCRESDLPPAELRSSIDRDERHGMDYARAKQLGKLKKFQQA